MTRQKTPLTTFVDMAVMLFKLRNVPEDEAQEIRELLESHAIDFYETPASRWGISMEAIWLSDDIQLARAQALIDDYQRQRQQRAREEYARQLQNGEIETLGQRLRHHPLLFLISLGFALIVVYFSIMPFMDLGRSEPAGSDASNTDLQPNHRQ